MTIALHLDRTPCCKGEQPLLLLDIGLSIKAVGQTSIRPRHKQQPIRHLVLAQHRADAGQHRPDIEPALNDG